MESERETTHLILDEGSKRKVIKQVCKEPPDVRIAVLAQALVVEAIHLRDLPRFVVPAQDGHPIAVAQFEGDEEGNGLDGVISSVDVVAHEEVVRVG